MSSSRSTCGKRPRRWMQPGPTSRSGTPAMRERSCGPGSKKLPRTSPLAASEAVRSPMQLSSCQRRIIPCGAKLAQTKRLAALCAATGLREPDALAEELGLLIEGARITAQSVGLEGLRDRVLRMGEAVIAAHAPKKR